MNAKTAACYLTDMFTPDRKCSEDGLPKQQGSKRRGGSRSYLFIRFKPIQSPARSEALPNEDFGLPSDVTAKNTPERPGKQTNIQIAKTALETEGLTPNDSSTLGMCQRLI